MRVPLLARELKSGLVVEINVVKEKYRDREVYIPVEPGHYLVVFAADGRLVGERVLRTITKTVKKNGKTYKYTYLRIVLPWSSKLRQRQREMELTIQVYKLPDNVGKREYYNYVYDVRGVMRGAW